MSSPVCIAVPAQLPPAAVFTCARILASLGSWPGTILAHAAVLPPTVELVLLLMRLIVAPQPVDVGPPKKHELRAIGKTQAFGGVVAGWAAHAIDIAPASRELTPITLRKDVGTDVANRHWTALTRVPSRDGVKLLPFQIPRTMFPLAVFPALRLRLMLPVRYGFASA